MHTGIVAMDALTPLGRGQSMAVFGPDELPAGAGRSELASRVVCAQAALPSGIKSILVCTGEPAQQEAAIEGLRAGGALESTMVLRAGSPTEGVLAMQAACSIAAAEGGDVLVVIDSLAPYLWLWRQSCVALQAKGVDVRAEEEGSQQRTMCDAHPTPRSPAPLRARVGTWRRRPPPWPMACCSSTLAAPSAAAARRYAALTERAHRRKDSVNTTYGEGSVTLLLLQPSASLVGGATKEAYTVADFEEAGFSQRAIARVSMLADKGVAITEEVLTKLAIPLPGSGHPQGGGSKADYQHLEELTSLVDGHVELREPLAAAGRRPPLDPSNSLTRIGVGTAKTLKASGATPAMQELNKALRLELAAASDPAGCEPTQQRRATAFLAVLQQPEPAPLQLSDEVVLLLAASEGLLDAKASELSLDEMGALLRGLASHVRGAAPELLAKVDATGVLLDETAAELRTLIADHLA